MIELRRVFLSPYGVGSWAKFHHQNVLSTYERLKHPHLRPDLRNAVTAIHNGNILRYEAINDGFSRKHFMYEDCFRSELQSIVHIFYLRFLCSSRGSLCNPDNRPLPFVMAFGTQLRRQVKLGSLARNLHPSVKIRGLLTRIFPESSIDIISVLSGTPRNITVLKDNKAILFVN